MYTEKFTAMGTTITISIATQSLNKLDGDAILSMVKRQIELYEAIFSRFREDSELNRINQHPGTWQSVSSSLGQVLRLAKEAHAFTDGLFNPCMGLTMQAIGYDRSFEHLSFTKEDDDRNTKHSVRRKVLEPQYDGENRYLLASDDRRVYLFHDYQIDLGGIAKGFIVEQVAKQLQQQGLHHFLINAGGDMVCQGLADGQPWQIGISDPQAPNQSILTLNVDSQCVATSGSYRRTWSHQGQTVHHLIDPKNGTSSTSDIVSCTVIATSLVQAEVFAKNGLLLGSHRAPSWLAQQKIAGWVLINQQGEVNHSWIN